MIAPPLSPLHLVRVAEMLVVGLGASFIGSMVGLGGGFIAVPVLRLFFHLSPTFTAGTSLFMVTANVASASLAFARQRRIDWKIGLWMGVFGLPGGVLGAIAVQHAPAFGFDAVYGIVLAVFAVNLLRRGAQPRERPRCGMPWAKPREFYDAIEGATYRYSESAPVEAVAGFASGIASGFFGVGGSVVVVPVLLRGFALPPHLVSATAHFVVLLSSPLSLATQIHQGDVDWLDAVPLAIGALVGAQFGAATAKRLSSPMLVRTLAVALLIAATSLIARDLIG